MIGRVYTGVMLLLIVVLIPTNLVLNTGMNFVSLRKHFKVRLKVMTAYKVEETGDFSFFFFFFCAGAVLTRSDLSAMRYQF